MAKARMYSLVEGAKPKRELRGQAAQVHADLVANPAPRLAVDIDKSIQATGPFKTRQDTLRVTLYYLLVFKNQGLVQATEQPAAEAAPVAEGGADVEAVAEQVADLQEAVAEVQEQVAEMQESAEGESPVRKSKDRRGKHAA